MEALVLRGTQGDGSVHPGVTVGLSSEQIMLRHFYAD